MSFTALFADCGLRFHLSVLPEYFNEGQTSSKTALTSSSAAGLTLWLADKSLHIWQKELKSDPAPSSLPIQAHRHFPSSHG